MKLALPSADLGRVALIIALPLIYDVLGSAFTR